MNEPISGTEQMVRLGWRSIIGRSLGIVATAILLGPPIGGIVVVAPIIAGLWYGGGLAATPRLATGGVVAFFLPFVVGSYLLGLLPALSFGILLCISAFWFRRNSVWAAGIIALAVAIAFPFLIWSTTQRPSLAETLETSLITIPAAFIAGVACWLLTKPLHRFP